MLENDPLVLAANSAASAYTLIVAGHSSDERGYRVAIAAAEQARDLFNRHLGHLETAVKALRDANRHPGGVRRVSPARTRHKANMDVEGETSPGFTFQSIT